MPSLETYRKFRFSLYMKILEDSKNMSKSDAWEKWDRISDYDMRPKEIEFLSFVVSKKHEYKPVFWVVLFNLKNRSCFI